jgi:hypothetical protein
MSLTDNAANKIMALFPTQQLRPDAAAHLRNQVYAVVFKHAAARTDLLQAKVNDLDRQLYIAKKKIEDLELAGEDDAVDPAGFNK